MFPSGDKPSPSKEGKSLGRRPPEAREIDRQHTEKHLLEAAAGPAIFDERPTRRTSMAQSLF